MSETQNLPQYLYHYTSVDSLALILKHKTIRLNSLDKMDDLQEQMTVDKQNFGKFVFVSSWTDEETEQIPMWRMYTPKHYGVRIKLPVNPFVEYQPTLKEISEHINAKAVGNPDTKLGFGFVVPFCDIHNGEFTIVNYVKDKLLYKVQYTNDNELLKPKVLNVVDDKFNTYLEKVGIHKNKYWAFQKEWRYRLMIIPISVQKMRQDYNSEMGNFQFKTIHGQASLPFNYYDLHIKDECFSDMSIMLAPDISESAKTFVNLLVKEYNPHCTVEESVLTNLIQ